MLSNIVTGKSSHVCNIYGPGGIGKTVVCHKFEEWCRRQEGILYGTVTGSDSTASTIDQMLSQFSEGLKQNVSKEINSIYEFSRFRLDAGYLTYEGQWVDLEPVAKKVLTILVEHHPNLVEDDELIRFIWKLQDVDKNRLEQAVSAIRKALKPEDGLETQRLIKRERNRGYRFVAPVTRHGKFDEFAREFRDYKAVFEVLDKSGGVNKVFTPGGKLRNPERTEELINDVGEGSERIKEHFVHRGTLEGYIWEIDRRLTNSLGLWELP